MSLPYNYLGFGKLHCMIGILTVKWRVGVLLPFSADIDIGNPGSTIEICRKMLSNGHIQINVSWSPPTRFLDIY